LWDSTTQKRTCIVLNNDMMFNGFKDFMFNETSPVEYEKVVDELHRLEQGHYLMAGQSDDQLAWGYMNGEGMHRDKFMGTMKEMSVEKMLEIMKRAGNFAIVLAFIPKRWFKQLPKNNILGFVDQMIGFELPTNYIWGVVSKINHEGTRSEKMQFYRNQHYHANDDIFTPWADKWLKKKPQEARPLEKAPRFAAPNFAR